MILEIFLLMLGFAMLVKGADWFVDGTSGIARKLGIPQLVVGLTIVAMGTSAPEAAVSITAALKNNAGIAIGNVIGSNILNILIIPVPFAENFLVDGIIAVAAGVLLWIAVYGRRSDHSENGGAKI